MKYKNFMELNIVFLIISLLCSLIGIILLMISKRQDNNFELNFKTKKELMNIKDVFLKINKTVSEEGHNLRKDFWQKIKKKKS